MVLSRVSPALKQYMLKSGSNIKNGFVRMDSSKGLLPPEPHKTSFGIIRVILTVIPGLLIGAMISKNIANFLEENDLFVPSDDDDDDD